MLLLEVMDKMPSAERLLVVGVVVGTLGFMLVRRWRWAVVALVPIVGTVAWARIAIYTDPHVGPAVWRESGWPYALAVALSGALAIALPVLGLWALKPSEDRGAGAA
jgi:nicotinamide riboside transporter PnuC